VVTNDFWGSSLISVGLGTGGHEIELAARCG
jgi:hypothetical protein